MKSVLSIAGSDSSGGAGIQADLKTITAHGMFGMTAITAVTVQNTLGVSGVQSIQPEIVAGQIHAVFSDIRPDAVKTGMLANVPVLEAVVAALKTEKVEHLVVDPVMVSTSGHSLLEDNARDVIVKELFPMAEVITPNIPEAEAITGYSIKDADDMREAARSIVTNCHCAVLVKGGHLTDEALDILVMPDGTEHSFTSALIESTNTHGTGCTLSSAIACGLAAGKSLIDAIQAAKEYITGAIANAPGLGHGHGPVNHGFRQFKNL